MATFNRYNSIPATLPDKEFALVKEGDSFRWYVGNADNEPVPHTGGINNLTEIPNRSYNDLQDLPELEVLPLEDPHTEEDIVIERTKTNPALYELGNVMGDDAQITISGNTVCREFYISILDHNDVSLKSTPTANLVFANGLTHKIKPNGTVKLIQTHRVDIGGAFVSEYIVVGDLVKEYDIRQSPDGTLWKVSVDNSGNEVITAL